MDERKFDSLTRRMAGATSRRTLITGLAAALFGGRFVQASAQTPGPCSTNEECGTCQVCQNPGASGTCAFVPSGQDPNNDCLDSNICSGDGQCSCSSTPSACTEDAACCSGRCINGVCLGGLGTGCLASNWCESGFCADSVCCDSACEGECNTCGGAGGSGVCINDAALCSDGNNCTTDICTAGQCSSSPTDCTGLDEICKAGICDAQTGECIAVNRDDGFVCGTNASCSSGQCLCNNGFVLCDETCEEGDCCDSTSCPPLGSGDESVCAANVCINNVCTRQTGDDACGSCQECDLETLECVERCDSSECCCDDNLTCSDDCCPAECKRDKDCKKGECCCKDGSCSSKCCRRHHGHHHGPPSQPEPGPSTSNVSTLPNTGSGQGSSPHGGAIGLVLASGVAAWVASRIRWSEAGHARE